MRATAHDRRYNILLKIVKAANDRLDPQSVIGIIMDNIQKLIPCEAWSILLLSEDQAELVFERARGAGSDSLTYARLKVGEGIAGWVALRRKATIVNDVAHDRRFNSKFDETTKFRTKSVLCAPLISRNQVMGVVELINKRSKTQRFSERDLSTLLTLLGPIAVSLHNAVLYQEKEKLAITDDLTKLYNNRFIHLYLHEMIDHHTKNEGRFSLIFLDLDGFKSVNDHYGHLIGGQTLVEVGKLIHGIVGEQGVVARYGGDEFVVIMPGVGREQALDTAERIRYAIENHDYLQVMKKEIHLSASLGISVFPIHADNITELIQKADQAMYEAKYVGKNATRVAF
jgi:diguanylate cyclase (GGDEF)-like protein